MRGLSIWTNDRIGEIKLPTEDREKGEDNEGIR